MMSEQNMPPQARELLAKFQQTHQNMEIMKHQQNALAEEKSAMAKVLEDLEGSADDSVIYKNLGLVMIRTGRSEMITELRERGELANTRSTVLQKQIARHEENLTDLKARLEQMTANTKP